MTTFARILAALMVSLLLAACGERKEDNDLAVPPPPADSLISQEKMALILSDIHLLEAAMSLDRNQGDPVTLDPAFYYKGIFEKYHITPALYERNLTWYRQNPDQLVKVYDRVVILLENRRNTLSAGR
jgi:hypothetical protein